MLSCLLKETFCKGSTNIRNENNTNQAEGLLYT